LISFLYSGSKVSKHRNCGKLFTRTFFVHHTPNFFHNILQRILNWAPISSATKQTDAKNRFYLFAKKNIYLSCVDNQPCSIPIKGLVLLRFFLPSENKKRLLLGGVKENNSTYTTLFQRHFSLCWNGTVATFFHLKSNNVFNLDTLEISAAFPTLSGRKILFKVVQKKIVELIKSNTDFWKQKKSANIFVNEAYTKNLL